MDAGISIRRQASVPHMGGFFPGSANVEARQQHLLKWMDVRGYGPFIGTAKLQVMRGVIPELDQQIKRAHIDPKTGKRASDSKVGAHDILDCLEYGASFEPDYHEPSSVLSGRPVAKEETDPIVLYRKKHRSQSRSWGGEMEIG